jgi:hypothetical protein
LFKNSGNEGNYNIYFKIHSGLFNDRTDARRTFINTIASLKYELNDHINVTYTGNLQLTNRDEQSHINQYTETPALTGAGANRNQTSEFFANQSSLRTYYGDFLVNFDYDLTDDLSLKANVVKYARP